jgi:hypothetical protein
MGKFDRRHPNKKTQVQRPHSSKSNRRKQTIEIGKGSYKTTLNWLYLSENTTIAPRTVDIKCGQDGIAWSNLRELLKAEIYTPPTMGTNLKRKLEDAIKTCVLDLYSCNKLKLSDTTILFPSREYVFRIKRSVEEKYKTKTKYAFKLKDRINKQVCLKSPPK